MYAGIKGHAIVETSIGRVVITVAILLMVPVLIIVYHFPMVMEFHVIERQRRVLAIATILLRICRIER
jgi:hypothetical protein